MTNRYTSALALAALLGTFSVSAAFADRGDHQDRGDDRGGMFLKLFDKIDADKDGKVTEAEIATYRQAEFKAADTNADGNLSADELVQMRLAKEAERQAQHAARMVERLDTDKSGGVSAEEMAAMGPTDAFSKADADKDGSISKDEAKSAIKKFGQAHRKGRDGHRGGDNDQPDN